MMQSPRRGDRIGIYLAYADEQSQYYRKQIADIKALLARDVTPFVLSDAPAQPTAPTLARMQRLLRSLEGVVHMAHTVVTTLTRDHQNARAVARARDAEIGRATELHARLKSFRSHLIAIKGGFPFSAEEKEGNTNSIEAQCATLCAVMDQIETKRHTFITSLLNEEERDATRGVLERLLLSRSAKNGELSPPSDGSAAMSPSFDPIVQLQSDVASNANAIRKLKQQVGLLETSVEGLRTDKLRLCRDTEALLQAREHVRRQCGDQLEAIEAAYTTATASMETHAADGVARATRERDALLAAIASVEEEKRAHEARYDGIAMRFEEHTVSLTAALNDMEEKIRYAGQYGCLP